MTTLRTLRADDEHSVLGINAESQPHVAHLSPAELTRLVALSAQHIVVEDAAGCVIGYALVFAHDADYDGEEFRLLRQQLVEPFLYIDQIALAPSARGRGIGRLVYAGLAQQAEAQGLRALCCEVNTQPANPASLAFHERLGFDPVGPLATQDGRQVVLLQRRLDRALSR